jgi:hypothetical protein
MIDEGMEFPRKWLDQKQYVRVDEKTGKPQLLRIEPMITDQGELITDTVMVYIDNEESMTMERGAAFAYAETQGWVPLEMVSQWKHKQVH